MLKSKCFITGIILFSSLQAKAFDYAKNAQEVGKVALYSAMLKDFIKDIAGIKNETMTICHELKKQRETLEEIKKQNEEIIKLLKKK